MWLECLVLLLMCRMQVYASKQTKTEEDPTEEEVSMSFLLSSCQVVLALSLAMHTDTTVSSLCLIFPHSVTHHADG